MTTVPIEERVSRLEGALEHIADDIKWMKWTMVSTFLAVIGVLVSLLIQDSVRRPVAVSLSVSGSPSVRGEPVEP